MRLNLKHSVGAALLALPFVFLGCSSASDDTTTSSGTGTKETTVEVFSWWTAPGEAEALQTLISLNRSLHPKESVFNAAAQGHIDPGTDAKLLLATRIEQGKPPDLFQTNAKDMYAFIDAHPGGVQPLDDLFAAEGLNDSVAPEVLKDVTYQGHVYAVPVNIHRDNSLFYNKTIFAQHGLKPPTTMAEFMSTCEALKKAGVTPLALSTSQSWIIEKLFMSLAVGTMGSKAFLDNFTGAKPFDADELKPALAAVNKVMTDYIDVDASAADTYGWTQATESVYNGSAAMFIHGDWVKGYLVQLGWTPDVDFGVVTSPGTEGVFLYGMDVFGVPTGAKNPEGARDFVRTISSTKGQIGFNVVKGSSPVRLDVPTDEFDSMGQQVAAEFKNAKHRIASVATLAAWDKALVDLARTHDEAAALQAYLDNPPVAK